MKEKAEGESQVCLNGLGSCLLNALIPGIYMANYIWGLTYGLDPYNLSVIHVVDTFLVHFGHS